ncbi:conserved hypothetical protein [Streptomyces viridochromogenes DSM 40736]|uniref:DUF4407 domain-containing protein n=1 Tax=Streptomyces viridochromogenes (strain DSM 40736 / JCM 4977 / BCRC 1201 / Tue 494) TaxID=591159 RepID=D9XH52_STRVT|nr:DUF4407 domain-containing protein [Streptomyces viridochromogenes]EFL32845.1 conserved hypothetical protein [Streptomyces viridochromogenes DSM 40736]
MATDTPLRPADSAAFDDDRSSQSRPAPPASGVAPRLRRLIGIDEGLLAWVPEERPRYTWYGALVVNTALLGAVSMVLALSSFRSDLPLAAVLVVAVLWFWVILALDSWLVSSTHGTGVRKWTLLVRFFLSVLLGLFIAEPILFQIFDKEIRQEIAVGNEQKVADYRGMLVSCNPTDGASTTGRPECARYQLKVAGSPAELARQIKSNGERAAALRTQVADINKTLNDKLDTEQRLCGPKYWVVRGGVRDVTITCERARKATSEYEDNSKLKTYEEQLKGLVAKGQQLSARKDEAADQYQPLLQKAVDDKTRRRAADLDTDGILTRAHGLKEVAESDGFALFLTIVLHLLLLCLDAMPVLAKVLSGATSYDNLLGARRRTSRRLYAEELEVQHTCARMEHDVRRHRVQLDTAYRMGRLDQEHQRAQAERAAAERAELEERMERIMRTRGAKTPL